MTKDKLISLLEEMTPSAMPLNSADDPAWLAHRKTETLDDRKLLRLLREIIEEHSGRKEKEIRRNAYFVMGKMLSKTMDAECCQYLVNRLGAENDKYVVAAMLDGIGWLSLPLDVNIEKVIECSINEKWLIRHSAIHALRSSDTEAAREAVRYWVRQEDEKKFKFELIYAHAALGEIGVAEDVELLEKHTASRIRDVRDSAKYAMENIRKRWNLTE